MTVDDVHADKVIAQDKATHVKPVFSQQQAAVVGLLGLYMHSTGQYYGKWLIATGFIMYFNASGFI